jgi:NAD(P)-dependent dehydrogenase (short-subunit alcohol dehydrogenase family)
MGDTPGPLHGQKALVTGGSTGIGAALCERLVEQGASVVSLALANRADYSHPRLTQHAVDLSDPAAVHAAAARIAEEGDYDILVNNAGRVIHKPLEEVTDHDFDELMNLHVRAAIILTQAVVPGMKERRYGRIVNLATRAIVGLAGRTTYSASKAAIVSMDRTWALELAPYGITVNTVSPGPIGTPMLNEGLPKGDPRRDALAASIPLKRLGTAEDVARAIAFFIDPANGWITGQNLFVCGGSSVAAAIAL